MPTRWSNDCSWPIATEIHVRLHVGDWAESGRVVLSMSFVDRDPKQTFPTTGACVAPKKLDQLIWLKRHPQILIDSFYLGCSRDHLRPFEAEIDRRKASMHKGIFAAIILVFSLNTPARSAQLEDAVSAAHRGDYVVAHRLLDPLAEKGDARAQFNIGYLYANGWGVQRDHAEAVKRYRNAADQGLAIAQHFLGMAYRNGNGVAPDPVEAARWTMRAADQGYPPAMLTLGIVYANGWGVPKDLRKALIWSVLARQRDVRSGERVARSILPKLSPDEITQARNAIRDWKPKPEFDQIGLGEEQLLGIDPHLGEFADPSSWPVSAVGVVAHRGNWCSGTLVAPKLVLTAAHCVVMFNNKIVPADTVHFSTGMNKGVPAWSSVAERVVVSEAFSQVGLWSPEHSANDWALIILKDSAAIRPVPVKALTREQLKVASSAGTVFQIGYGQERRYSPSILRNCQVDYPNDSRLLAVRCFANPGYSGSPVLAEVDGEPAVIGVLSAGQEEMREAFACSAMQFEKALIELIEADKARH